MWESWCDFTQSHCCFQSSVSFLTVSILRIHPITHLCSLSQMHGFVFLQPDLQLWCLPSVLLWNRANTFFCNLSCRLVDSCCAELVPRQQLSGSLMSVFTTQLVSQGEMNKSRCPGFVCSNWLDTTLRWFANNWITELWKFNHCIIWLRYK